MEEDVAIDTKKSVAKSIFKKMKVDQNELVEIDFCVALGNTLYGVIRRVSAACWHPFSFASIPFFSYNYHVCLTPSFL